MPVGFGSFAVNRTRTETYTSLYHEMADGARATAVVPVDGGRNILGVDVALLTAPGVYSAALPSLTSGGRVPLQTTVNGFLYVHQADLDPTHDTVGVGVSPTGGAVPRRWVVGGTTLATGVLTGTARVYGVQVYNLSTSAQVWLHLYDKASAPAVGTDVPVASVPGVTLDPPGGCLPAVPATGWQFDNGVAFAVTTTLSGTTPPAAGSAVVMLQLDR